jgi:predicted alpha/beta superfamily hydrolase
MPPFTNKPFGTRMARKLHGTMLSIRRRFTMKRPFHGIVGGLAVIIAFSVMFPGPAALAQGTDIVIGRTVPLTSKVLGKDMNVQVSVPDGYDAGSARYPVLYVLNGAFSFAYDHGTVQILSRIQEIPGMIVIGVPSFDDGYVPTPLEQRGENLAGADRSIQFLREELIPFVERTYRTNAFRILYGHSVGGLFTMYTMFNAPDLFSAYIAGSPWFQVNDGYWLKNMDRLAKERKLDGKRLFMTVGKAEADLTIDTYKALEKWMNDNPMPGLVRKSAWVEGDHGSMVGRNTYDGLLFIFDGWKFPEDILRSADIEKIEARLAEGEAVWGKYGFDDSSLLSEIRLNALGYQLLARDRREEAVRILSYAVRRFPKSFNALDSLAEAYMISGDKENAVKFYRLALERNPGDSDYARRILENSKTKLKELADVR